MKIYKLAALLFFAVSIVSCNRSGYENLTYVNPLIGTKGEKSGYGGMMPYTGVPFGSAQWVPMTRLSEVGTLSYNEMDTLLLGFIASRQPAIWMGEWGQVSFQPQVSAPVVDYAQRGQFIENQKYTPYEGCVEAGGITTRYAALEHSAVYEISSASSIVIDASRKPVGWRTDHGLKPGHLEFSEDGYSASGWNSDRFDAHYSKDLPNFKGYFYFEFSRPFSKSDVSVDDSSDEVQGYVQFDGAPAPLVVRMGVSLISVEQAKENLHMEIGRKSVAKVSKIAARKWAEKFSVLDIDAPDDVKTIFYTGLYHSLLYPRQIDEYGRYYSAFDDKVHDGVMYNCWSMWDTYRAEHPLLTLIVPERIDDMMQSLVEMYHEGGWLPKWPNPTYTGIMGGDPAETILAEAWTKGFRGFDVREAYNAVKKSATVPQPNDTVCVFEERGYNPVYPETRAGLTWYQTIGYVPGDITWWSVSLTQDYGLQDLAAAVLADAVGEKEDAAFFRARSYNYRILWNAEKQLFLPRLISGEWREPQTRSDYTECTPEIARWCVPYDVEGMTELMGGKDVYEKLLDEFFNDLFWKPARNKSIHGNEPSHHIAYLYNRIGVPEKTQFRVREIMSHAYSTDRNGFDGNEDCGQMSAWYIMSALGLYMLNPADGWYEIGSPCVNEATLKIGKPYKEATLHIKTIGQGPDKYKVRKVSFNGRELTDWRIHHSELIKGGELLFEFEPDAEVYTVEDAPGYNCWPMIQSVGDRLICVYTIGKEHNTGEKGRAAYMRFSDNGARTWSDKILVDGNDAYGTSSIGKGLDNDGKALFWIRRMGTMPRMALYRTSDGTEVELLSTPHLDPLPMQITDIFHTPEGLECLWFSDDYSKDKANKSWGVLLSRDNGATWEQTVIEDALPLSQWPTEPSVVSYGDGRMLAVARSEAGTGNQFQLTSSDWGHTWTKCRTNIGDVHESTPSLILDGGIVYNYYYQRGPGLLKLRKVDAPFIFAHPDSWPGAEVISYGGRERPWDSGNANAVTSGDKHYITYYSGDSLNCSILVAVH